MFFENKKSIVSVTEQLKLYNLFKENDKIAVNYLKKTAIYVKLKIILLKVSP